MTTLRRYLIAGLLVWLPLGVTVLVVKLFMDVMDRTLLLLPPEWRPETVFGTDIPGIGLVLSLAIVIVTGVVFANFLGRRLVGVWEAILARIPLVRTIYGAVKQVAETVFADSNTAFRKVMLVEYPRRDMWCLAFQTGDAPTGIRQKTGEVLVSVFVPTTPNPTSGFVLMVPEKDVIELDMSVDDGLKLIMSLGVVAPAPKGEEKDTIRVAADGASS